MVLAIIIAVAVIAVIAIIIGLVKGFSRTKTWATEYVFAAAISILIFSLADTSGLNEWVALALKVGVPAALTVVFAILSDRFKAAAAGGIERAQKRSYYLQYGDVEQNRLEIMDAIELNDKRAYNRLTKKKFRYSRGGAGVADRIFGAITLLIKVAVIFGAIAIAALIVIDFAGYADKLGSFYSGSFWSFISRIAVDLFIVAAVFFALRAGYRTGISGALWVIVILALIAGAGYLTFSNVDVFEDLGQKIVDWASDSSLSDFVSLAVAEYIIAAAIFVVALILIIIVGVAVGGAISRAREDGTFGVIDGVVGAIVALAIVLVILLALGGLLWSMSGSEALEKFNDYMTYTSDGNTYYAAIASAFYNRNPINSFGWFENLPFYMTLAD